jgi:uncharacterized membrane protein YeaQ/YmgE (transglycosylase-associated protein family)
MDVNIIWVILVGIVIGFLARLLMPGRDPIGFVMTAVIGIAGALIGTYLWNAVFEDNDNEGVALFAGVVVAVLLLWIYRQITYGRRAG